MLFYELNNNSRRVFIDTVQLYEAYRAAYKKNCSLFGGMHWKKSRGREYLFKSINRLGNGKSLGPRSQYTEKIISSFRSQKAQNKERLSSLSKKLNEQSKFCKAAMIQRVPVIVAKILRILEKNNLLGKNYIVVGTNAIYAYEAAAGVFFDSSIISTNDVDILWDTRRKLAIYTNPDIKQSGFIGLLKKVDKSFEILNPGDFRATNDNGFMVDIIKPMPKPVCKDEPLSPGGKNDLKAVEIAGLEWLISSPKFSQVVIGEDGFPALLVAPDPRAFILHKLWLSTQIDRDAIKKSRDQKQAQAVLKLINKYLPQYKINPLDLRMFPFEIINKFKLD